MVRRVYRMQGGSLVLLWVANGVFVVIGVGLVAGGGDPGKGGTANAVFGVAIGVCVTVFALWMLANQVTSGVTATADGLACRRNFRTRLIGWPEVESFTVSPGARGYPRLVIRLTDGSRVITNITSFTAAYPSKVARELTALQARAASSAPLPPTP
jgi:hypothetical protein